VKELKEDWFLENLKKMLWNFVEILLVENSVEKLK
jgi:hypothetical protein